MTGIFANLKTDGLEQSEDRLGGFQPLETNAYDGTIKMAYAIQSKGGAHGVVLTADAGGREYRETIYISNRKGENFFLNKSDKTKKVPLPGFTTVNDICLMTTDKELSEQTTEEKVVNVYDPDAKKEMPKSVPVLMDLIGKSVILGIVKETVNKTELQGTEYVPTAETRDQNFIDKVFHSPSKITVAEARQAAKDGTTPEPKFYEAWVAKNRGQTRDNRDIKDGSAGAAGAPSAGPPAAGTAGPKKSLFGGS